MMDETQIITLVKDMMLSAGIVIGLILFKRFVSNGEMKRISEKLDDIAECVRRAEEKNGECLVQIREEIKALKEIILTIRHG